MSKLLYTAGHNLVFLYYENRNEQVYIHGTEGTTNITCMTLSPSKRYLAFSEEADYGIIYVYDLKNVSTDKDRSDWKPKRKKLLTTNDSGSRKYTFLSFSTKEEGKYLAALAEGTNTKIILWEWDKMKARATVDVGGFQMVNQMFYHPTDDHICVLGQGNPPIKFYTTKLDKSEIIFQHKSDMVKDSIRLTCVNFLSYCLLAENHCIIGTEEGELVFMNAHYELKTRLPSSPFDEFQIKCIVPHSKGFLIGGSNATFYIYDKNDRDHRAPYTRIERKIQNKDPAYANLAINSCCLINDDTIVCGFENGSLMEVPFSNEKTTPEEKFHFDHLILPFHTATITDFDICLRKPLLATCSMDKYVKIWNYTDFTLENSKEFEQAAQAITFHPSGFHLAVAFNDRVKMLNILYNEKKNDLRCPKDINIKNCTELSYSNGGHLLAVANGSMIQVYGVYSGEQISSFAMRGNFIVIHL